MIAKASGSWQRHSRSLKIWVFAPGTSKNCPLMASRVEDQRELELEAVLEGKRRLDAYLKRARERGTEGQSSIGSAMTKQLLVPVANLLTNDLNKLLSGKPTKGGAALRLLYELDPLRIAAVAIRAAIDFKSDPRAATETAGYIGRAIEEEYLWRCWEQTNAREARHIREKVNERTNARVQRNARSGYARRLQPKNVTEKEWTEHARLQMGYRFIDYLVRCGLFKVTHLFKRLGKGIHGKAALAVKLTDEAEAWSNELADLIVAARPLTWPLIARPVPWSTPSGGGFHFRQKIDHPSLPIPLKPLYIASGKISPLHRKAIACADLSNVYAGLNAAQDTPWRINRRLYGVLAECIDRGIGPPDLAPPDPSPRPARVPDITWAAMAEVERRAHRREIAVIEKSNREARRKRIQQHRLRKTASRFVECPEIYFAYQLDWRGRVYPLSPDLAPNGSDKEKALLEFAHGDPLTERGVFWLKVHVANTYGFDKVSFEERAKWTEEHEDLILSVARQPLDDHRWHEVSPKKRWQFLAACFAYDDYKRGEPICRIPVMLDGTCSGLQHWAAVMRDEEIGRFVNLLPSDKPADLYSRVAGRAEELLRKAAQRGERWALDWAEWEIDRSIAKPVVMGFPYGKTLTATLDDVRETTSKLVDEGKRSPLSWLPEREGRAAAYAVLAKYLRAATEAEVASAKAGQRYVQQIVDGWKRRAPTEPISWTSPSGWPVVAEYRKGGARSAQLEAEIDGKLVKPRYFIGQGPLDWATTRRAMPPNFIHSIDGAHVAFSLKRAAESGINQLAAVHDAFGTTPSKTGELAQVLRDAFVEVHRAAPLKALGERLMGLGGVSVPVPPEPGGLDIESVSEAAYLFS